MNPRDESPNPFVGLRPFESRDSLYYFGRRQQTHALLQQIYANRFVAVIGSSGCGKSSLVRAGLIPNLEAGFVVQDRDLWKIATFKPGDGPRENLARAMANLAGSSDAPEGAAEWARAIERRGAPALVDRLTTILDREDSNLLVVVDQFEELFRFQQVRTARVREEAADFVALLLHLAVQTTAPVYVVLTMRSDFLGECDAFQGLPEAMNRSQYLVPRLTRQQRREAILGPIRLAGADITPRLMDRLLNESQEAKDDLPVLQHALMRTWSVWSPTGAAALDLENYERAGTIRQALCRHADEALAGLDAKDTGIAKRMFQALTQTDAANRRIRRPAHLGRIAAICGESVTPEDVRALIARFNSDRRNFLVLAARHDLDDPLVDISHESLIRHWTTLAGWVDEEAESLRIYKRLAESAELHAAGQAGLYKETDLQVALAWQRRQRPNAAWADRLPADFAQVMHFLRLSVQKQKTNRHLMVALIFNLYACLCGWMVIAATDDVSLALDMLALPVIGTPSPVRMLYTGLPLIFIGLQAWFLFHLQRLLQIIALQPPAPDGSGRLSARLEQLAFHSLAWLTVPAVLTGFWLRYLLRRDGTITAFHVLLLALSVGLTVLLTRSSGSEKGRSLIAQLPTGPRRGVLWALVTAVVLSLLTVGVFEGKPERYWKRDRDLRALVPWVFHELGYDVFFDFREQHVSRLPDNYWTEWSASDLRGAIRGAHLKKMDLRYADMIFAFLAKANLRNADLRGSRLRNTDFREADLRGADMTAADMRKANFQSADFREAILIRANFGKADLTKAQLGNTRLGEARFRETTMKDADLRCADLRGATSLTVQALRTVKTLYRVQLDEPLRIKLAATDAPLFAKPVDTWHDMTTPFNVGKKDICE
jgi:energy-coupling factor transporter ATP-binding protein EcfA2